MLKVILITFIMLTTFTSYAETIQAQDSKKYTLGLGVGTGQFKVDKALEYANDAFSYNYYFNYQYNNVLSYELNLVNVETDDFCIITCFQDLNTLRLEYKLAALLVKGSLEFSKRWSGFGKIGANYHQLKPIGNNGLSDVHFSNENGIGPYAAVGFEFRALNGFGLMFDYSYAGIGDYRSLIGSFNVSYKF